MMTTEPSTVLIVDDDEAIRESLELLIGSLGIATRSHESGTDFLAADPPAGPACVLLDVRMPDMSGLEVQERLLEIRPDLPVIFLSGHGDVPMTVRALKNGAVDFLQKPGFNRSELLECIQQALRLHAERRRRRDSQRATEERLARLTRREREVMELVVAGEPNKNVAARLGISERTVEIHRGHLMKKLAVRSVAELVRLCGTQEPAGRRSGNH